VIIHVSFVIEPHILPKTIRLPRRELEPHGCIKNFNRSAQPSKWN
jgi:hypothetical protein